MARIVIRIITNTRPYNRQLKNDNFQLKAFGYFHMLLKTLIVGTRLNRLTEAVLTSTHNLCFRAKIRK